MRIGLYGLPTAGKSYILNKVKNLEVLSGSTLLNELEPKFQELSEEEKVAVRARLAIELKKKNNIIMDGHYAFGDTIVFTEEDGKLYDVFLYLYIDPKILANRMKDSIRNKKYLQWNIEQWQINEMESLRSYCHKNNKDFYVIDNPEKGFFSDITVVLEFINHIVQGFSCVNYAREMIESIPVADVLSLLDGDRTFIEEDSSAVLGYKTHVFDGNFYTGFQSWRHNKDQTDYLKAIDYQLESLDEMNITINQRVVGKVEGRQVLLTSGYCEVWKQIAKKYGLPLCCGQEMCADTKYFITKFIQERGTKVLAFGDSMNDYFMLKQANKSYLVLKKDGSISSSFREREMEGFEFV